MRPCMAAAIAACSRICPVSRRTSRLCTPWGNRAVRRTSGSMATLPTRRSRRAGPSSGSSSPMTSPPIARRSATAPTPTGSATSARRGRIWRASTAPAPSARRTSTTTPIPRSCCSRPAAMTCPATSRGIALVGDPRNDVHLFMNQIQIGFIKLHNRLVDRLREDGVPEPELFEEARRAATWHYQWVILHEFLPTLIGRELTEQLLDFGADLYRPGEDPYIPFEFSDAAYRYGHSQIRQRYRVNEDLGPCPVFPDLIGFCQVPAERRVDWSLLFDVPGRPPAQRAKRIDGRLPESLIALPEAISRVEETDAYASLANRDLQRGQAVGLPSGEAVAGALGVEPISPDRIGLAESGWTGETPLWIYVLREADALHDGDRLGPVGGRIVGEVLVGIIDADPESFRSVDRSWRPTLATDESRPLRNRGCSGAGLGAG